MTKGNLKGRFRLGEWLAEKLVTLTAFVSLTFIALIFVFVFKEAFTLFTSKDSGHGHGSQVESSIESYGEDSQSGTVAPMETYGDEPVAQSAETPIETYGEEMAAPSAESAIETYGEEMVTEIPVEAAQIEAPSENEVLDDQEETVSGLASLWKTVWQPISDIPKYGLWPLFVGSLKVTFISILIGGPIAILAALFTTTFAPKWARELMKPVIEILAGFPSVVIGFFALTVMATYIQNLFGLDYRLNAFTGGIAMSLAVIPIIFTLSEDALAAIPKSMSEASMALGARKWETALYILLPAAMPGIFAALLLGFGRAFGETMIVLMATGNAALMSFNLVEPVRTLSATVGAEMAEVVFGEFHYSVLFFIGSLLFVISFSLNLVAEFYIRQRLMKKFRGV